MQNKKQDTKRVGPRMQRAINILHDAGGEAPCMLWLAERVGPHGSRKYGYAIVHRLIDAGICYLSPDRGSIHGKGALVLDQ